MNVDYETFSADLESGAFREELKEELLIGFRQIRLTGERLPTASHYASQIATIVGNAAPDLEVWRHARIAYAVNPGRRLEGRIRELGVPHTGRGAGTSIAGNALSTGLVLDTSRYLNRVLSVDPERRVAVVEPGTVLDSITKAAAPFGLRFGPDPSTHSRATIGGAIGNNACGSRALRYGRSADNVVELDVLTGTGVRFSAGRYGPGEPPSGA